MKLTSIGKVIETYEIENGFYLDIQEKKDTLEFYIYHKDYAIKNMTMGIVKEDLDCNVLELIQNNIENPIAEMVIAGDVRKGTKIIADTDENHKIICRIVQ